MSVFDTMERSELQDKVLSGEVDSAACCRISSNGSPSTTTTCLPISIRASTCPVSRGGNAAYALRQSFKKSMLAKLIKKSTISKETPPDSSHTFFSN